MATDFSFGKQLNLYSGLFVLKYHLFFSLHSYFYFHRSYTTLKLPNGMVHLMQFHFHLYPFLSLDLPIDDCDHEKVFAKMFYHCPSLTYLD